MLGDYKITRSGRVVPTMVCDVYHDMGIPAPITTILFGAQAKFPSKLDQLSYIPMVTTTRLQLEIAFEVGPVVRLQSSFAMCFLE